MVDDRAPLLSLSSFWEVEVELSFAGRGVQGETCLANEKTAMPIHAPPHTWLLPQHTAPPAVNSSDDSPYRSGGGLASLIACGHFMNPELYTNPCHMLGAARSRASGPFVPPAAARAVRLWSPAAVAAAVADRGWEGAAFVRGGGLGTASAFLCPLASATSPKPSPCPSRAGDCPAVLRVERRMLPRT